MGIFSKKFRQKVKIEVKMKEKIFKQLVSKIEIIPKTGGGFLFPLIFIHFKAKISLQFQLVLIYNW
jgi:hypothetical protein